jgi:hypothetical protein
MTISTRQFWQIRFWLCVLSICVVAAIPVPAFADAFFNGLDGKWRGNGFIRIDAKAPEENIRCRLDTALNSHRSKLFVRGTCSIGGFMLPINGSIVAENQSYTADLFKSLVQITTNSFSGSRRGSVLQLHYKGSDSVSRQKIEAYMTISKRSKNRFDIALKRTDPATARLFDVGTIRFDPQ